MREPIYSKFTGQLKKMRLVSNNLCYGPPPEPEEEIEQHLTLFSDGRVYFTGYKIGEYGVGKYQKKRSKRFKVEAARAGYLLGNVGLYFSEHLNMIFATDIGTWTLELTNTDGKVFEYEGSLCDDPEVEHKGLSVLLRKYLNMPELFGFDGCGRTPINRADDEYILVGVSFGSNGKTYCYICEDNTVMVGDEVLVPVGSDGEYRCVQVECIDVVTKDNAPFPIEQCKKVIGIFLTKDISMD